MTACNQDDKALMSLHPNIPSNESHFGNPFKFSFTFLASRFQKHFNGSMGRGVKKRKARTLKNPKLRGEWVESVFMARANEEGLTVSKPWGDSRTFDFVVGRSGHFVSVQVKCTSVFVHCGYPVTVRHGNERYARGSFDFLAGYVIPEDAWYIIPAAKFAGIARLTLCSTSDEARYEEYREAWHLLREAVRMHGAESQVSSSDSSNEAPEPQPTPKFPTTAFGRLQSAMNFCKKQMQVPGSDQDQGDEES